MKPMTMSARSLSVASASNAPRRAWLLSRAPDNAHYPEAELSRAMDRMTARRRGRQRPRAHSVLRINALQGREEFQHAGGWAPTSARLTIESGPPPEVVQHVALHFQVAADVAPGCGHADVAEEVADDGEIDACLQKRDGTAVPEDVRSDPPVAQARVRGRCPPHVPFEYVRRPVTGQW